MLKFLFFVMTLSELAFRQTDAGTCIHYAKSLCFPQWRRRQGVETGGGRGGGRQNERQGREIPRRASKHAPQEIFYS